MAIEVSSALSRFLKLSETFRETASPEKTWGEEGTG